MFTSIIKKTVFYFICNKMTEQKCKIDSIVFHPSRRLSVNNSGSEYFQSPVKKDVVLHSGILPRKKILKKEKNIKKKKYKKNPQN